MKRALLNKLINKDKYIIDQGDYFLLDCSKNSVFNIEVKEGLSINIYLKDIKENSNIQIDVAPNSILNIKTILKDEFKSLKLSVNLDENSRIQAYCADFSCGNNDVFVEINLNKRGSSAEWHLASLSAKEDNKTFDVSLIHHGIETRGLSDNYGVSKDDARLVFSGVSLIKKGAKGSKTRQNAKIMVFDEMSKAIAKPVLKIDENEIEASHGATVGKISDDTMFYLTSRGLSEEQAKELITMGYLRPILNGFEDDELKNEISSLIEGRM